ncbi:MAG: type III-B CRISPR module RAMP protein Cmr4 [Cyclobacteriaceae bacterium]
MNYTQARFYLLRTLTPLHAGSGETEFGVIDNRVQRDINTGLPTIHASSLKGALKEFFKEMGGEKMDDIFGKEATEENPNTKPGGCKFLSGDMLSRPVRSDVVPWFQGTTAELLTGLQHKADMLGAQLPGELVTFIQQVTQGDQPGREKPRVFDKAYEGACAEETGWTAQLEERAVPDAVQHLLGQRPMLMHTRDMSELELPVVARNHLENGKSENLWYEEIVPYDTRFGFFVVGSGELLDAFEEVVNHQTVQVGANATIGYGLCRLTRPGTPSATTGSSVHNEAVVH